MRGLMQDWPLLCHRIIEHAAMFHGTQEVVTRSVEGPIHRTNYAEIHTRALKVSQQLQGAGIKLTRTVQHAADIAAGSQFLREGNGTVFLLLRVNTGEPPVYKRIWDPAVSRAQFRMALAEK